VQDPVLLVVGYRAVGLTLSFLGAAVSAHTYMTQGMALYDLQQHCVYASLYGDDAGVTCGANDAWTLWRLGAPDQSVARIDEVVTLAQQLRHPSSLVFALGVAAMSHALRREGGVVQEHAETAINIAMEQGFPYWRAQSAILRGWALAHQGQVQEGIEQMTQGLRAYRATGAVICQPYFLALLADVHKIIGQPEAGLMVLTEALTLTDTTEEHWCEPELYRLKGALLLQQNLDNQAEAESCFHHALALARNQQAKSFELRSATSLARLWYQQGKRQEAHDLLAPVYNWFTEGFDTADLKDAKALLDELA
jgi:predicted ATPase